MFVTDFNNSRYICDNYIKKIQDLDEQLNPSNKDEILREIKQIDDELTLARRSNKVSTPQYSHITTLLYEVKEKIKSI